MRCVVKLLSNVVNEEKVWFPPARPVSHDCTVCGVVCVCCVLSECKIVECGRVANVDDVFCVLVWLCLHVSCSS